MSYSNLLAGEKAAGCVLTEEVLMDACKCTTCCRSVFGRLLCPRWTLSGCSQEKKEQIEREVGEAGEREKEREE